MKPHVLERFDQTIGFGYRVYEVSKADCRGRPGDVGRFYYVVFAPTLPGPGASAMEVEVSADSWGSVNKAGNAAEKALIRWAT